MIIVQKLFKKVDYSVSSYFASLWVSDSKQKYCKTVTLKNNSNYIKTALS